MPVKEQKNLVQYVIMIVMVFINIVQYCDTDYLLPHKFLLTPSNTPPPHNHHPPTYNIHSRPES